MGHILAFAYAAGLKSDLKKYGNGIAIIKFFINHDFT